MTRPVLVPFRAEHLLMFEDRNGLQITPQEAVFKETSPAFTVMVDDRVLGCAGVMLQWRGMGVAWTVFSKDIAPYMIWATFKIRRILRDIIRAYDLHRVEITVMEGMPNYERWARLLGFEQEWGGRARAYTQAKENVIRMEMITK